jgi:UDP-N-acetylglucosamine 4,6-dehydratase/5-epimerase
MSLNIAGKSICITGGTGSFGKTFVSRILTKYPDIKRVIIFSRDELKQFEMQQDFPENKFPQVRFFLGDIRDKSRLLYALENVDIVVHAAALKQVPAAEYNPFEAIKTNVIGSQNVIEACIEKGVSKVIALSTDKAAAPINLYGATKLCSDKLFIAGNYFRGNHDIKFSVVRYGNVLGSRGSVIPFFLNKMKDGFLPITHKDMSRFNITLDEGVDLVLYALEEMWGGEIYVPKIPSYNIMTLANAIAPNIEKRIIGIRPGEKIHEEMITETDSLNTIEFKNYYVILPSFQPHWDIEEFRQKYSGEFCAEGFKYNSGTNLVWLTEDQIREQIKAHIDLNFKI